MTTLVLVAGLPRAGKTTFARHLCAALPQAAHLPLDKYFFDVPAAATFLEWVQRPEAIDWATLAEHLERLKRGYDCYTPCIDWEGSGQRISKGGDVAHPRSVLVRGGARYYVIPGCFAFALPLDGVPRCRVFVQTPFAAVAARWRGQPVAAAEVETTLTACSPGYDALLRFASDADVVIDGTGPADEQVERVCAQLHRRMR